MSDTTVVSTMTETFVCQNCGGVMKFDVKSQKFICGSCKAEYELETLSDVVKEYDFNQYLELEKNSAPFSGVAVAVCQNCGLEIAFDEKQISTACPMCGSSQIAAGKQRAGLPPEGIVPFKIDRHDAQKLFREWVKKRWFAPGDFKKKYGEGELSGMYLPFWTYDASVVSRYEGEGGKHRTVRDKDGKTKTVTDWFPTSGTVTSSFDDVLVCASEKENRIKKILPYNTVENAKPYAAGYLAGHYAELYTIKADAGFENAKRIMEETMRSLARDRILRHYDAARVHTISSKYSNVTYKHMLLPLWSSAYGYKGKTYSYLINGETGKVSGDRPWSAAKLSAAIVAALAVIILLIVLLSGLEDTTGAYNDDISTGGYAYGVVWTGQGYY